MLRERHALNPQQQEGLDREARREKDGKHSIGIGEPKRTVRWIDFIPKPK